MSASTSTGRRKAPAARGRYRTMRLRVLALALLAALVVAAPASAAGPRATGSTDLALRIERILEPGRHLAISPLSVEVACDGYDAGARGRTRAQISAALQLKPDGTPLLRAMAVVAAA